MSRESFIDIRFSAEREAMLHTIDTIVGEYQVAGYTMTVRQLYYQLVARGFVENTLNSYKRIASLVNDGRMAGKIDWRAIEDRTRDFTRRPRWTGGSDILGAVADQFHMDAWAGQHRRVFVIVEKEALVGVLESVCWQYDVPLMAARGYPSASVLYDFAQKDIVDSDFPLILHLGDHDPSGLDMTRDLEERIRLLAYGGDFEMRRIALNYDQIATLNPPPNPAKATDARFDNYARKFGRQSWELDALPPDYLVELVRANVAAEIDEGAWKRREDEIADVKLRLSRLAEEFE